MSDRAEFTHKAEEILKFVETYAVMRCTTLEKFFPQSEKVINYLLKHNRLTISPDKVYIGTNEKPNHDKAMSAALNVLGDIIGKVKTHVKATPPAQISFLTHNNDYYEIIFVGYGLEAMTTAAVNAQDTAKKVDKKHEIYTNTTKRIVIVEDKHQMERLQIQGTVRYALVQPNGSLTYFSTGR